MERLQLQQYTTAKRNSIVDEPLRQAANVDNSSNNNNNDDSDEICATIDSIDIMSINTERRGYFLWFILQKGTKLLYFLFNQMQKIQPADKYGLEHTCYERHDAHVQISSNP